MHNEYSNDHHTMFPNYCRTSLVAACIWMGLLSVVAQGQTPTVAPSATPSATPLSSPGGAWAATDQEGLAQVRDEIIVARDEIIVFRRLVIIMAGIGLGWQTCLLLFKYH
jgi:hypothetical protein